MVCAEKNEDLILDDRFYCFDCGFAVLANSCDFVETMYAENEFGRFKK